MPIDQINVPVIMFHSVGSESQDWPYRYLSEDICSFEKKINYLLRKGYTFIFHDDLYRYIQYGEKIKGKQIMLTFDDGYLDNWTIVFPLLKRLGVKYTVYISKEFVDPSGSLRPTLNNVWSGDINLEKLPLLGYLSWIEMRTMEQSGFVDIQSHTSTHSWCFTGDKIIDFISPGKLNEYPWIAWNNFPEEKPNWTKAGYLQKMEKELLGCPVYENKRSMIATKYFETPGLSNHLSIYIKQSEPVSFFNNPDWRNILIRQINKKKWEKGHFENTKERRERLAYELKTNKDTIEKELDKEVRYLCWPGGAHNEELLKLAEEYGYLATTVKEGYNRYGDDPSRVHRISSGNTLGDFKFPWKYKIFTLKFYIARFQRKIWAVALDRIYRRK